jgi:arginine:agmatine antiporter
MDSTVSHKKLGPFLATMVVVSTMIGAGIYLLPAGLGTIGSISILGWAGAVVGAATLACVFSCLAVLKPSAAGLFSYIRDELGSGIGFVAASLYWFACWIGGVAVALAVTGYLSVFLPAVAKPPGTTISTIAVVWLLIGANIVGPRFVARMQSWSLLFGLAPVLLVAVGGWFYFHSQIFLASWNVTGQSFVHVVPRSIVIAYWAFLGVESAIILAPRVRNPARDVPIASLGGLAIASAIYISACAAIMGILPASVLAKSSAPFADAVVPVLGASVAAVVALCAMLKASGTLGAVILLVVETAESESMLGQIRNAAIAHQTHKASTPNLIFTGVLMSLAVVATASPTLARQFTIVADITVVLIMFVYVAACFSLLRMSGAISPKLRLWARALATAGALFCLALIAASEADLLIWSAAAIALATLAYAAVRLRRGRALKAIAEA